ncbi:MAG: hypothetical protein ACJ71D_14295, partial [Nitrososphaera sp.]
QNHIEQPARLTYPLIPPPPLPPFSACCYLSQNHHQSSSVEIRMVAAIVGIALAVVMIYG